MYEDESSTSRPFRGPSFRVELAPVVGCVPTLFDSHTEAVESKETCVDDGDSPTDCTLRQRNCQATAVRAAELPRLSDCIIAYYLGTASR